MPKKKAATKKRIPKKTGTPSSRKSRARASTSSRKKKASSKKPSAKKAASRKKAAGKKKPASKRKTTGKKAAKRSSKRKIVKAGRTSAKRKGSRKKVTSKKPSSKVSARKKSSKKKTAPRPRSSKKKAAAVRPAARRPAKKTPSAKRAAAPARKPSARRGNLLMGPVRGFEPYQPKRGEEYMSQAQLEHFRQILQAWKRELMEEVDRTMHHMKDDASNPPDPNDRATQETEFGLELRTRDRERKLLKKIQSALDRIDDGSYGYCEETGDEIGLRRLEARPVATLCVEAQERRELAERQFRDRDDYYR
jgi:DnaK suppressor protein